jgi:hypothetical protein
MMYAVLLRTCRKLDDHELDEHKLDDTWNHDDDDDDYYSIILLRRRAQRWVQSAGYSAGMTEWMHKVDAHSG